MSKHWWKGLGIALIFYSLYAGLMNDVPRLPILNESIRNLYFHVSMWFTMIPLMLISVIFSVMHLSNSSAKSDMRATVFAETGLFFSILGLVTGMLWAKFTWGDYFPPDPKLNGTAITMLIYGAYFILRGSLKNPDQRGRISAIYNIFAFVLMIVFIGILPRLTQSLHPGNGGNPGFGTYDLDNNMRAVFYPAVIGWILFGVWIAQIRYRIGMLSQYNDSEDITNEILD
ncbi:ABC transporter permease [Phaeocystidibacter luteus]|uniref:ABC transporter permease n=1 Tax=Phaeocystidibacter luteus TaxID=911197 RepID=A0A6N6RJ45_9FLAO|nr:ABC transporter permease [Phaeocystidibacter luteus]